MMSRYFQAHPARRLKIARARCYLIWQGTVLLQAAATPQNILSRRFFLGGTGPVLCHAKRSPVFWGLFLFFQ
jgi:hypothetical protein